MRALAPAPALALALALGLLPAASAAPEQVHLGITEDPSTALTIHWIDLDPLASDAQSVTVDGEEVPARLVPGPSLGKAFEARIEGLSPGTEHEYTIGGQTFPFRTPPRVLTASEPIRIVALGDHGVNDRSAATVAAIEELAPDLVLHMGDISYAEGRQNEWIDWFRMVEPVAARRPWVTALGNHETYTGASPWALVAPPSPMEIEFYKQRFGLPGNEIWYSFDWAGIHVVALDTFSQEGGIAQEQVAWLEADLAANADAPWTIVFLHEPPFSSNANHGSSERAQDAFTELFARHGVDLVLAAHDHSYERTVAIDGVVYVVSGGGGQSLYDEWEARPDWSAARGSEYHVTLLEIHPDRIDGRVVATQDGPLEDAFTLARANLGGAPAAIVTNETPTAWWIPLAAALALVFGPRRRR